MDISDERKIYDNLVEVDSVNAEFNYIEMLHGNNHDNFEYGRLLIIFNNKYIIEIMDVVLNDGTTKTYYFDITSFYGDNPFDELTRFLRRLL